MNSYYCKKTEIEYKIPDHWGSGDICAACIHFSDCQEDIIMVNEKSDVKSILESYSMD